MNLSVNNINLSSNMKFAGIGKDNKHKHRSTPSYEVLDADYVVIKSKEQPKKGLLGRFMELVGIKREKPDEDKSIIIKPDLNSAPVKKLPPLTPEELEALNHSDSPYIDMFIIEAFDEVPSDEGDKH